MNRIVLAAVALAAFADTAIAATVSITFERTEDRRAVPGTEATNLYVALGVRFPSRPTIQRDGANQVLQQGRPGTRPDPLPDRVDCAPLVMEFSAAMGVREVRMRVINRHLRSYSVQAFAGSTEVDVDTFTTTPPDGPPFPPFLPYRDIVLEADAGEGDITRVVANPPSDCFDLMVIDNLVLTTTGDPVPIDPVPDEPRRNTFSLVAYEVTQGVMSRLTRPTGAGESIPDTRLMALTGKSIRFVEGRNTGVRFFFNSSFRHERDFNANLRVSVLYRDGSRRNKTVPENTDGGRAAPVAAGDADAQRREIVKRRARVDESLDYVIPGLFLANAASMRAQLTTIPSGTPLITVVVDFDGPYRMGLNVARVNGVGMDAAVGAAPPRTVTSLATQFVEDLFPVSGFIRLSESGVLTMNTGAVANCNAFLAALDATIAGTAAAAPIAAVNYWSNVYIASNPPGCGGLGWYNTPGALTNTSYSTVAHEISHNIGINHATNLHGEGAGGAGDNETWPYTHGSIGAVDETMSFDDGVFGVVMNLNAASVGVDMIDNWGVWTFGPVAPCISATNATLFPNCTAGDGNIAHDYMSYGPTTAVPIWGQQNWISDVNYHRVLQWFETCIALDPPHRFQTGSTFSFTDTSGECSGAGSASATGAAAAFAATDATPQDALVFSGIFGDDGAVSTLRVLRKIAEAYSFANPPGPYTLVLRAADGSVLRSIAFDGRTSEGVGVTAFVVVAPYDAKLATVDITLNQKLIFSGGVSGQAPPIALISPKGGEIWGKGKHRIEWKLDPASQAKEVYVQYSPDKGATWLPLGLVTAGQTSLEVDVADLRPSNSALVYVSAVRGLDTGFAIMTQTFAIVP